MSDEVKSMLVKSLESLNDDGASINEFLADCLLSSYGKATMDESIIKRKRGRPRKEEREHIDLPKEKFARVAMLEERKAQARMKDRLNPGTTREEKKKIALNADLREVGWDLEECPGKDVDFKEMNEELANLKKEAGITGKEEEDLVPLQDFKKAVNGFKDLKEEVVHYYGKAKEYLKSDDFRRVEEFLSYLKTKPAELTEKYKAVEKAYDELCEAICSMSDSNRRWMGIHNPTALEVEKNGLGMMDGEDYETYSRRMKSLGLGREIPKTIADIDRIVEQTERRWRSVAGMSQADFESVKANWQKVVSGLMKRCFIGSNVKVAGINRILEYGLDFGDYDVAYGVLQPMSPYRRALPMGCQYGNVIVKWRPYNVVATMAFADSISIGRNGLNYVCPSFVTNPSPCSFNPTCSELIARLKTDALGLGIDDICKMTDTMYCELQLHGDGEAAYGADAVESIFFESEYDMCNLSIEALSAIEEFRIALYLKDEQVKIKAGKIARADGEGGSK